LEAALPSDEVRLRDKIAAWGRSMFERGLTAGSSGNLSARVADGFLVTPTNVSLGLLDPARLSKVTADGRHVSGDPPTKEIPLHLGFYEGRPETSGVVHLHSPHATALSSIDGVDPDNAVPPITPYVVMRVGRVPIIPYMRPGHPGMRAEIARIAKTSTAFLLANHGPVVGARSFESAVYAMEELEETARLVLTLHGRRVRLLTEGQIAELNQSFDLR
jgi:3-dehydro-4-phosphotetronate decarboxylase